nr:hypothetical protein Iba_scaffold44302CG0010 [Ipomoea batatas]GMD37014.1 hypothetical protein Iba_chr09eCG5350 [Ipomoea batatas]GME08183.1 hypothetical protein Iba_scaffold7328CG0010 [Ipomoea batatas]
MLIIFFPSLSPSLGKFPFCPPPLPLPAFSWPPRFPPPPPGPRVTCSSESPTTPEFPKPHREHPLLSQNGIDIVIFPGLRTRGNCNASTPCPRNPILISRVIEVENRVLNAEIGSEKNPSTKRASRENTGRASINAWSKPESWRWNSCCSCLWTAPEFGISWVVLLDWEKDKEGLCFIKNLSNKWRTPEIKNITASITMKKRTPGLILLPEEDDGVTVGEIDSFWEK